MTLSNNCDISYIINYVSLRNAIVKAASVNKPEPFRLVMINFMDFCQFCSNPSGDVYEHYINRIYNFGFLSCKNCCSKAKEAVEDWFETKSYGEVNYLRNKNIKVKRTSGIIESD